MVFRCESELQCASHSLREQGDHSVHEEGGEMSVPGEGKRREGKGMEVMSCPLCNFEFSTTRDIVNI